MRRIYTVMLLYLLGFAVLAIRAAGETAAEQWWAGEGKYVSPKVSHPTPTVEQSITQYGERCKRLLAGWAGKEMDWDRYGDAAIADLAQGQFQEEANRKLQYVLNANHGMSVIFAAVNLMRAYCLFRDGKGLSPEVQQGIKDFFLQKPFKSTWSEENGSASENLEFQFHVTRYLMAQAFPTERFAAYGKSGEELMAEERDWVLAFLRFRARRGWGEFDSAVYYGVDFNSLTCLYDFAADPDVKRLAGMMLNLLLADIAVDSLNGMYGGAHARVYYWDVLKHSTADTYGMQYLYFGNIDPATMPGRRASPHMLTSTFRPDRIVVDIALNRSTSYENFERRLLHKPDDVMPRQPLDDSIRKYTYWTPQFVMGCVQFQDPYPSAYKGRWYAHHEQQEWDLSFGTRLRARIFTHHPGQRGDEHGYWTGDMGCGCGHFFQHQGALLALYDIPANEPYQYIHAYMPKNSFDEVAEENGFIFIREGSACAALKILDDYKWTTEGPWQRAEITSTNSKCAVICEAGLIADFGDFATFRKEIAANPILFDREKMHLTYTSKRAGKLAMDAHNLREWNDTPVDLQYPTFASPYIRSAWDSGVVELMKGNEKLVLDFTQ